jgi:hypothetical protein
VAGVAADALAVQPAFANSAEDQERVLAYDDPVAILLREHKTEKQKREEQEIVVEQHLQQRQATEQQLQDDEDRHLREWFASPEYRRALNQLSTDMDDARTATARAQERAALEQQRTREALDKAQRAALVVDGGRVYFTRDGRRLYGEDDRQITDQGTVAEAQRQQREKPNVTTYEEYKVRTDANRHAADIVDQLGDTAKKLAELDKRIKKGDLSPEDLAQARRDQQDIIDGMPPEARAEYVRLQAARKDDQALAYRQADPAFASAPNLNSNFQQAATAAPPAGQGSQSPAPAYVAVPGF